LDSFLQTYALQEILFHENNDYIIACKPAGLLAEEDPSGDVNLRGLLEKYLKETYPWKKRAICQLVNRLDKPVGGLLICAKKQSILVELQNQFTERKVKKEYLAIIEGIPSKPSALLKNYLRKSQKEFRAIPALASDPEAKMAELEYQVIDQRENYSLLRVLLKTGRFHQIRFQLSQIQCPIWNDVWYGAKKILPEPMIGLYSYALTLRDPKSKDKQTFVCFPDVEKLPWSMFKENITQMASSNP